MYLIFRIVQLVVIFMSTVNSYEIVSWVVTPYINAYATVTRKKELFCNAGIFQKKLNSVY